MFRSLIKIQLTVALFIAGANAAHADLTWNSSGPTNNWSTSVGDTNWTPGNVAWSNGENAIFGVTPETVTVTTANTVKDMSFTGSWTIANGAGALTLADNGVITVTNSADITTFTESIAGTGLGITKEGAGMLSFNNTNTYTGATIINAGTLRMLRTTTNTTSGFTVNTGGTLQYHTNGSTWSAPANAVSLSGGTVSFFATSGVGQYATGGATVTVNSASAITVQTGSAPTAGSNASSLFLDNGLKGSAPVTITSSTNGVGVVLRTSNSDYSGTITVNGNASATTGTGSGLAIGAVSTPNLSNASIIVNGMMELGTVTGGMGWANGTTSGTTFQMNALGGSGVVVANMGTAGSTRTLSIGNNGGGSEFTGIIANGANNTLSLIKNGAGTEIFSGLNTYSGTTTVNLGTLLANTVATGNNSATGTGAVIVAANATLGGTGQIRPAASNAITVDGTLSPGASIGTLTIDSSASAAPSILGMNSGAVFKFELGAAGVSLTSPGTSDRLVIAGSAIDDVTFNSNTVDFGGTGAEGFYKLFDTSLADATIAGDTWNGLTYDTTSGVVSSGLSAINVNGAATFIVGTANNGGDLGDIYVTVVPEPGSFLLLAGGLAALAVRRRRCI